MSVDPIKKFHLRPAEKTDSEIISRWFQDVVDLATFDRTSRIPLNQSQTEQAWIEAYGTPNDDKNCCFIIESEAHEALGMTGLDNISQVNRDAIVPLFIEKSFRRSGIGIRATSLILDFAFRQLGLNRVTSYYRADNMSSQKLLNRLGFHVEGTMRQAWFADGQFHDMLVVGILQSDWMGRRLELAKTLDPKTTVMFSSAASSEWSWPPRDRLGE